MSVPFDLQAFYRFCNQLKIDTKEHGEILLGRHFMGTQTLVVNEIAAGMENGIRNFVTLKCLAPETPVLCADLVWRPIGELNVGQELVAFDEHATSISRKMRTATVDAIWRTRAPARRITVEGGAEFVASLDHRVLRKQRGGSVSKWACVKDLRLGDEIKYVVDAWRSASTYEDGWIGGMLDGEGCLRSERTGLELTISQVDGPVFQRALRYVATRGYTYKVERDSRAPGTSSKFGSKVVNKIRMSRGAEILKLLGTTQPSRWRHLRPWQGKDLPGKRIGNGTRKVVRIEDAGVQDLVDISTSTQTFIAAGLCHHNCRQIGVSTISLAFDLFWIFRYRAIGGMLITHDDPARDQFRMTLDMYYDGLPDAYKQRRMTNNRNGMLFANKSRLLFRVAGLKKTGGGALGRSAAIPFLHATEVSSWGDPEGLKSLRGSLAEHNPNRFYHWESTARGFNHFEDMWQEAKRSVTQKAIFVSFWANEFYRAKRHSDIWKAYWGHKGRLSPSERDWVREVKSLYGVEIDDTQMAWWRWKIAEEMGEETAMMQEFPPTENHAFVATGSQFFTATSISDAYKKERGYDRPRYFRVQIGTHFKDTALLAVPHKLATLYVWEEPHPKGIYVLGADPAYGSSEWADRFCISVWRCYADRLVQVAEFVDPDMATYSFAWVLAYLAGAYEPCRVNLEINGPGQAVLAELQNMRRAFVGAGGQNRDPDMARDSRTLMHITRNMSNYLYRRLDSLNGSPGAIHTLMGHDFKERMFNTYRDYFERGFVEVRSRFLIDEMKSIEREGGAAPAAQGRNKDDRVIAAALATITWNDHERTRLMMLNHTYALVTSSEQGGAKSQVDRMVSSYLKKIGVKLEVGRPR